MNLTNKILSWNGILGIIHSNFKNFHFYFHIPKFSKPQQTKIEVTIFGSVIPKNPRRVTNPRIEIPICPFTHRLVYLQNSKPHKTNEPKIQTFFTNWSKIIRELIWKSKWDWRKRAHTVAALDWGKKLEARERRARQRMSLTPLERAIVFGCVLGGLNFGD